MALYGYKGETLLRGKIEAERVTEIPKDIPWQAYQTALHLEGVTIEAKYQKAVKTSCKKLMSLTSEDPYNLYEEDEDGIYCFMCMPILASRDDFKKFIHHSSVLKRHIEEDEFFNSAPYFYNQSNDEPKILYLDVKKDGSCHYYISRA
ncbi:MAG TPA: hypothetical protein VFD08_03160 [Clostridia bacterium]|nr:hypothetical protein [Clostridia bacterium]